MGKAVLLGFGIGGNGCRRVLVVHITKAVSESRQR